MTAPTDVQVIPEQSAVISAEQGNDLLGIVTKAHVGRLAISYSVKWSDGRESFLDHSQVLPVSADDAPLFEQAREWRDARQGKLDRDLALLCQPRPDPEFPGNEWTPADLLALGRMLDRLHRDELRPSTLLGREGNEPTDDQADNADMLDELYLFGDPGASAYWTFELETAERGVVHFARMGRTLRMPPFRGRDYTAEISADTLQQLNPIPLFVGYATAMEIEAALNEHGAVARWPQWEHNLRLIVPHERNPYPPHVFER